MGWGASSGPVSPALLTVSRIADHDEVEAWHLRNYSDLLVSEREVALSIAYGLDADPHEVGNKRTFDWATERDWNVELQIADVRWHGVPVDRIYYWVIDNTYACPVGSREEADSPPVVSAYKMAVADAINDAHGAAGQHSYYFTATGQIVQ
ncbi:hypothetical protein [Lentzea terrae]|uniref:hypothetical protein n=1 Tax=Lentzea terrae TaxID=2200761 RepID=UPI000DD3030D|nr:hypothetical protein [Lentzea terrae]